MYQSKSIGTTVLRNCLSKRIMKILTRKNVKELRNLGTLAYKIKCKWENQVKKAVLRFGGGEERHCT